MKFIQYLNQRKMKAIDKSCQICVFYETNNIESGTTADYYCSKGDKFAHYLYHCNLFENGLSKSFKQRSIYHNKKKIQLLTNRIKKLESELDEA